MATTITTAAGLQDMDLNLTEDYILGANIDCSGIGNFEPVGGWNGADPFTGTFDGKGYTISNLTVDRAADDYIGLFGETDGADIRNVTLRDFVLTGDDYIGTLIGYCTDTPIDNITIVNTTMVGDNQTGSMIGVAYTSGTDTIDNCTATGSVTCATGNLVGGLIGQCYYSLRDCSSSVIVIGYDEVGGLIGQFWTGTLLRASATGTVNGHAKVGGSIGNFRGNAGDSDTIDRAFATGDVTGTGDAVGGFVGEHSDGIISDCYAKGDVDGDDYVGGFAGESEDINRCYSTGAITHGIGASRVGGFTGLNRETITLSFWDTQTSGEATGAGGGSPQTGLTGKTTALMKDIETFLAAGWSIPSIWNVLSGCVGGYPCLVGVNACCSGSAAPPADPTIAPKKVSLELIRNIEMMNTGRSYIDKSGNFVYESRFAR